MDRTTVRCKPRAPKKARPRAGARPLYTGARIGAPANRSGRPVERASARPRHGRTGRLRQRAIASGGPSAVGVELGDAAAGVEAARLVAGVLAGVGGRADVHAAVAAGRLAAGAAAAGVVAAVGQAGSHGGTGAELLVGGGVADVVAANRAAERAVAAGVERFHG